MKKGHIIRQLGLLIPFLAVCYASPAGGEVVRWVGDGAAVSVYNASKMFPSITGDGSGGAFVVWEDYRSAPGDIYVQRVSVNGTPVFSSDKDVTVGGAAARRYPAVAKDGSGGAFVVWEDDRNGTDTDIYIQRIDSNGNPAWNEDKVVCSYTGDQWAPQVILVNDGTGDVIVVWEDHRGAASQIYAQRMGRNGNPQWTSNGVAVAPAGGNQFYPAVSSDGYDGAVAVWEDQRNISTTGSDIYAQRVSASGAGQWGVDANGDGKPDGIAATTASGDQWFPSVAADGSNHFMIAWEDYRANGIYSDIYAMGVDYNGLLMFAGDKAVSASAEDQRLPRVAHSTVGDSFIIAWEDYRNDPVSYTSDIYAQKIGSTGTLYWQANGAAVSTAPDVQDIVSITSSGTHVIAAWEDFRGGAVYDIYAISLPIPGSIAINNDAAATATTSVNLALWAGGIGSNVSWMCISNTAIDDTNPCATWEAYNAAKVWDLVPGEGTKTVYVQFKDTAGNVSAPFSDDIILSYIPYGSVSVNAAYTNGATKYTNSTSVTLTISATNAAWMSFSNNNSTWSGWEAYSIVKTGWTIPSGDGQKRVYARFKDQYGNVSTGSYYDDIVLDTSPPTGTVAVASPVVVRDGITYVNSRSVTLSVSATDAGSGVRAAYSMHFHDNVATTWSDNYHYAATASYQMDAGEGSRRIYAAFADNLNQWSGEIASSSFILDTIPPAGSVSINGNAAHTASTAVNLTLSATDSGSGIDRMCISDSNECASWEPYGTAKPWTLPSGDGTKTVYVKFRDIAGNISTFTDGIILDTTGPAGSITINNGDTYTNSTAVNLALSATDALSSVSEMRFSNDDTSWSTWEAYGTAKSWPLPSGDGSKTVYVQFKDSLGNMSTSYADMIILDTAPPTATVSNVPASPTNSTSATLTVGGTDVVAYKYRVDSGGYSLEEIPVANSIALTSLPEGSRTVYVIGRDTAGNWQAEANATTASWTVDTTPPVAAISGTPANPSNSTSATLTVGGTDVVAYKYKLNAGGYSAETPVATPMALTSLPEGSHTVYVIGRDTAGNWQAEANATTVSWTVDTTKPSVSINPVATPTNQGSQTVAGSRESGAAISVSVNTSATVCASPNYPTSTTWSCSITNLAEGSNIVTVTATDAASNSATVTATITYDNTAPTVGITSPVAGPTKDSTPLLTYTVGGDGSEVVTVKVDGNVVSKVSGNSLSTLGDGSHTVRVEAVDSAGNTGFAEVAFTVDTTAPTVNITSPVAGVTNNNTPQLTYTVSDGTVVVKVDGSVVTKVSGQNLDPLTDASHSVRVEATDAAGNTGTAEVSFTVDTIAPAATISGAPSSPTRSTGATLTVGGSGVTAYKYKLDGGLYSAETSVATQINLSSLADGPHTVYVIGRDGAGNWQLEASATSASWNVDTTAPMVSVDTIITLTNQSSQTISGIKESGATVTVTVNTTATVGTVNYPTATTWSVSITNLVEGPNIITVTAADAVPNSATVTANITYDKTAPSVSIASPAAGITKDDTPLLTYTVSDGTVVVKVDGNTVLKVSGDSLEPLNDGVHIVRVESTDSAGNTGSADVTFEVDTTVPTVTITSPVAGVARDNTPLLAYTVSDGTVVVKVDGVTVLKASGDSLSTLADGSHTVRVESTDSAGNTGFAEAAFEVDTTAPTVNIDAVATPTKLDSQTITGTVEAGAAVYVATNTAASDGNATVTGTTWSYTITGLIEGANNITVTATDAAGNSATATKAITYDITPPTVSIDAATIPTKLASQTITGTVEAGASVYVATDTAASGGNATVTGMTWSYTITGLIEGANNITVTATDAAGNSATATKAITRDTTAPTVSIDTITTPTKVNNQVIGGSKESGATINVSVPSATVGTVNTTDTTWSVSITNLAEGVNTIAVTAADAVPNIATATATITYDKTAPTVGITSPSAGITKNSTQLLAYTVSDGTVTVLLDGDIVSKVSGDSLTSLSDGVHTVRVESTDSAGNTGSAEVTFTVDTNPPSVGIDPVATPTNQSSQTITGSRESGAAISVSASATAGSINYPTATTWNVGITNLAEGVNTITVTAADAAGNSAVTTKSITYDKTAPALSVNPVTTPTNQSSQAISGTREKDAVITVTVPSAVVGTVGYPTSTTWNVGITSLAEGLNAITVKAADSAGNNSVQTSYIVLDTTPPTGSISINGNASYTNSTSSTLTLSCSDPVSGCSEMQFSDDNYAWSAPESFTSAKTWPLDPANGFKTVYVRFKDNVGNWSTADIKDTITLDTTPPTVRSTDPVNGATGVSLSSAIYVRFGEDMDPLTLNSSSVLLKTGESIVDTSLSYDSASKTVILTPAAPLSEYATYTIAVTTGARDIAGNPMASAYSFSFRTNDTTLPTSAITYPAVNSTIGNSTSFTIAGTASDTGSGVLKVQVSINGVLQQPDASGITSWTYSWTPSSDGTYTVASRATDVAGNIQSPETSITVKVDNTPPATTADPPGNTYATAQSVMLTCNDGVGSGCYRIYYTTDGAVPTTSSNIYAGPISITADTTLRYFAADSAGNVETAKSQTYTLDAVAPNTTASQAGGLYNTSLTVILTASEAGTTYYSTDGSAPSVEYTGSLNIATTTTLKFFSRDTVGNDEQVRTEVYTIDTSTPTGSISINNAAAYTNSLDVTLTISASDVGSGVTQMRLSVDGASWKGWEGYVESKAFRLNSGDGNKTIYVQFKDVAGNISEVYSDIITLDTVLPEPEGGATPAVSFNGATAVADMAYSYSNIDISWNLYPDAVKYELAMGTVEGGTDLVNEPSLINVTSYEKDLQANVNLFGKTIYVTVKAVDRAGNESILKTSFIYTPADINSKAGGGDGRVDGFDLGKLGIAYAPDGPVPSGHEAADINRDGKVDNDDLFILAVNFGKAR